MTPERYQQIDQLVDLALELPDAECAAFLDRACAGDDDLRRQVEALLAAHQHDEEFLAAPAFEVAAQELGASPNCSLIGQKLGHYQILSLLAVGGMGEVYLAEDLLLNRQVAIKMLPPEPLLERSAGERFLREARAASAINHPHVVTIHAIEEVEGRMLIVMEYVPGETLAAEIERGPIPFARVIDLFGQVADAVSAAHEAGLIHRDLKPANILITPRGRAKVVDFGLAKHTYLRPTPEVSLTGGGLIIGTVAYMSPEQTRGEKLDERSDVFSLGCVLYEAATGQHPFKGASALATMHEIVSVDPPPPSSLIPELPHAFDTLVNRALAKDKGQRFASVREFAVALNAFAARPQQRNPKRGWSPRSVPLAIGLTLITVIAGAWFYWRQRNLNWAREAVTQVERLMLEEKYDEAYELAAKASPYLPGDSSLARLSPIISDDLSVSTEPAGANVYLKRFAPAGDGHALARQSIGVTPIKNLKLARGDYILSIEKEGFAPLQRTISSAPERVNKSVLGPPQLRRETRVIEEQSGRLAFLWDADAPVKVKAKLIPASQAPDRMVFVPGGEYSLVSSGKPTDSAVKLDDYFIDQFEVSNREFEEFIKAGGYLKKEFWKYPVVRDGKTLTWDEAIKQFKDRTQLPGPRGWSNQTYPEAAGDHPVTEITWYEAAAYAAFRGKQLPTIFQWEKAAREGGLNQIIGFVMPWGLINPRDPLNLRANFAGKGTFAVESLEFGMSPYGCYQMAGNVSEWLLNAQDNGFTVAGGSWKDLPYLFAYLGSAPGLKSANTLGFRCVLNSASATGDQGSAALSSKANVPVHRPVNQAQYQAMLRHYQYDATPLDPQMMETIDTDHWRREKIGFTGADGERAMAYFYLPKNTSPLLQVINYYPSSSVDIGLTVTQEIEGHVAPFIKAGRAVFAVVLKGYIERPRPPNSSPLKSDSVRLRESVANKVIDIRRGLDYLVTRREIDPAKIAFFGVSMNQTRLTLLGVETRYRSIILMGCGYPISGLIPETDSVNFLPHAAAPKLMIHGRYDEIILFRTAAEPIYRLLSKPKRLLLHDGGHIPPLEVSVPAINQWLDETLGPVKRGLTN